MKHLFLNRYFQNQDVTLGFLKIVGQEKPYFYTLERPWKNNEQFISCIPDGDYLLKPFSGTIWKDVYKVTELNGDEVKGRSDILTHWGSFVRDLEGCISIGQYQCDLKDSLDGEIKMGIANTQASFNKFRNELGKETHRLTIRGGTNNWS